MSAKKANPGQRLRILCYNIQVGIQTQRYGQYITHGWKHLLPYPGRRRNLDRIGQLMRGYDIVGLQEVDAGSIRTTFINQTEYLARTADMPFWQHRTNRNLGQFAQHSLGLVSRYQPQLVQQSSLPGRIPGRGVLLARYGYGERSLLVGVMHLALSRQARLHQLDYVAELVRHHPQVVLMGDFNCTRDSLEMRHLLDRGGLELPPTNGHTYPSWRPEQSIDHILVSPGLEVEDSETLRVPYSDHLPVSLTLRLPEGLHLATRT